MATKWCALAVFLVLPALVMAQSNNSGWLGVEFVMESDQNRVVIVDLQPDGPAAQANLKPGDVIARVGDMRPKNAQEFADEISKRNPGDKITLTVMRDGKEKKIDVTLGRRPDGLTRR
jgi:S1-C subfamily serine protease